MCKEAPKFGWEKKKKAKRNQTNDKIIFMSNIKVFLMLL